MPNLMIALALFLVVALLAVVVRQFKEIDRQRERLAEANAQLRAAAEIGEATAEICHNIDHFLQHSAAWIGALEQHGSPAKMLERLRDSQKQILRLTHILRTHLDPGADAKISHTLRARLEQALEVTRAQSPRFAVVETTLDISADATVQFNLALPDVFINLIKNAFESMDNSENKLLHIRWDTAARTLSFTDTGHGIAPEHRDQLFDLHFSTKGKNMGLGMAFVKSQCEKNGSLFYCERTGPEGTTFAIQFN